LNKGRGFVVLEREKSFHSHMQQQRTIVADQITGQLISSSGNEWRQGQSEQVAAYSTGVHQLCDSLIKAISGSDKKDLIEAVAIQTSKERYVIASSSQSVQCSIQRKYDLLNKDE
jgi:hypothetical protein